MKIVLSLHFMSHDDIIGFDTKLVYLFVFACNDDVVLQIKNLK